jgi:hypothetical protein
MAMDLIPSSSGMRLPHLDFITAKTARGGGFE